jgi:hypothetical protein
MIVGLVAEHDLRKGGDAGKCACIGWLAGLAIITRYFPRMGTE